MRKILIVDDDNENRSVICEIVGGGQYQPIGVSSGREALQVAVREQPDLVLLDVNMPEMNGFEVCKRLRGQPATRQIPVIMLTTVSNTDSKIEGLSLGADDYITKPFHSKELIARITARLRRGEIVKKEASEIELGNLKIDPKSCQVWVNGQSVKLTQIEFELLRYFVGHPNEVVDRNRLLGDLWPDAVVTNRTVDTHVANLRKKIYGFNQPFETIYGAGYILKTAPQQQATLGNA